MSQVQIENWSIIVDFSAGGDYLAPSGLLVGHPTHGRYFAIPGTFVKFDPVELTAESISGTKYRFNRETFHPNGNAPTLEDAVKFLQEKWTKNIIFS